jgi:hypothetical protein
MIYRRSICILFILIGLVFGQSKRDPRSVALAGAYSTVADGLFAVGFNPAMLAYQQDKPFMLQMFGFDFGIVGNYISFANLNALSGDTLYSKGEKPGNPNFDNKTALLNELEEGGGLNYFQDIHLPIPILNFSSGNMALTTNMLILQNYRLPFGLLQLVLDGNADNPDIDMTMHYEVMGVTEYAFTFAVPYEQFSVGMSFKYLQGIFYFGIDPDSSKANLVTTDEALYGNGVYYLRQGIGGSGIGLDIGLVSKDINGFRFGFSIINALGSITWNKENITKDILDGADNIYGNDDDLFHFTWAGQALNDSMAIRYVYSIDSVNASTLSNPNLFTNNDPDEQIVYVPLDEDGNLPEFTMNYPAIFRLGMSYNMKDENILISSDMWTGFSNSMFSSKGWRWSMGLEMTKFSAFPLRIGFAWGGADFQELGLGFGIHKGPIIFDFGFAFRNGIWIHSMKGINISTQLTLTGFRGRESKKKAGDNGPAPVPDEMDTEGAEESAEEGVEEGAEETVEESLPDTEEQK